MIVIAYNPSKHQEYAKKLLSYRNMAVTLSNDLPEYGLIALEQGLPVAMGFIRRIEGPYIMLDSYISDPHIKSEIRHRALDIITQKLIKWGQTHGMTKVFSFSEDSSIITRASRHGMVEMPDFVFQLRIL